MSAARWAVPTAVAAFAAAGLWLWRGSGPPPEPGPPAPAVLWTYEAVARGAFVASPRVAGPHLFLTAIRDRGLSPAGAVLCLDRAVHQLLWEFDDGGAMLHSFSTPAAAGGRLFVGEGMHANFDCHLYALDAATGRKLWAAPCASHVESNPQVADGKVYVGAGDEGVLCLDAASGRRLWWSEGPAHVDASPVLAGGRVYAASGVSRRVPAVAGLFALDAATGHTAWRTPTGLPAWATPALDGGALFAGLGNGRLTEKPRPPERPAGAVVCLDADTGAVRWRFDGCDAVFGAPAVDGQRVYAGSRDGGCYALDRATGAVIWRHELGSPVAAGPVWAAGRVVAVGSAGRVCGLDPETGAVAWALELPRPGGLRPRVLAAPAVADEGEGGCLIYVATELMGTASNAAVLYCLKP